MNYVESTLEYFIKEKTASAAMGKEEIPNTKYDLEDYATAAGVLAATGA